MATPKKVMKYSTSSELANLWLEDLPDELIIKVFSFLETRDLICLGQLSIRIRAITHDEQFWQKINLSYIDMRKIPARFLKMAIENGCKYLSLYPNLVGGTFGLDQASPLTYLKLQFHKKEFKQLKQFSFTEELLLSCHSLQKLSMNIDITFDWITLICNQNGKTLQVLDLNGCKIAGKREFKLQPVQVIVRNCTNLKEVNFDSTNLSEEAVPYLVENITPSIEVLSLNYCFWVNDEHIKILVNRCRKLKTLNLATTRITTKSLTDIIETLKPSLEKLDVYNRHIDPMNLLELRAMPKLQILIVWSSLHVKEQLQNYLPNLVIYDLGYKDPKPFCKDHQQFIDNFPSAGNLPDKDGIWEIKVKPLKLFRSS